MFGYMYKQFKIFHVLFCLISGMAWWEAVVVDKDPVRGPKKYSSRGNSPDGDNQVIYSPTRNGFGLSSLPFRFGEHRNKKYMILMSCSTPKNRGEFTSDLQFSARYKIHYPGWDARWDEWVVRDRLRWSWQTAHDNSAIKVNDSVEIWCSGNNVPGAWLEARVRKVRPQKLPPGYCRSDSTYNFLQKDQHEQASVEPSVMVVGIDGIARPFLESSDGKEYDVGKVLSNGKKDWEPRGKIRPARRRSGTGDMPRSLGRGSVMLKEADTSTHSSDLAVFGHSNLQCNRCCDRSEDEFQERNINACRANWSRCLLS